jgi:hypothetical protein
MTTENLLALFIQELSTALLVLMIMGLMTFCKPPEKPRKSPVREGIEIRTIPEV